MTCQSPAYRSESVMRRDILVAAAVIVVLPAISTLLTPLYGLYREQMGISLITLTLIYAVYVIGNLGALLVFGGLSDAVGRRPVVLASFAIAALSAVTFIFARHGWELGLARVFSGLGVGIGSGAVAAWLVELMGPQDRSQAAIILTTANFIGLGAGALLAGALADHAPAPLLLPFVVYLAVLAVTTALVLRTPETVAPAKLRRFALTWPKLGVPADLRASFVAPAISGFGSMALVGFYACLAPGILAQTLGVRSNLAAGAILFELAAVAAATILMTRSVPSARAMWVSLLLIVPAIALVVVAQISASLLVMIAATALCGVAAALGYSGSLQVVNRIAPPDRRAEMTSALFVCCFLGNALPVIGVGVLAALYGSVVAVCGLALLISVFALAALWFSWRERIT